MARKDKVARCVTNAIIHPNTEHDSALRRAQQTIYAFFTLYSVHLHQHAVEAFSGLRGQFGIDAESYVASFRPEDGAKTALQTKGHMGYSGSTFFTTNDGKYLVKSVPRHFENSFFRDDLLQPYVEYMGKNLHSLLIRITDFLAVDDAYKLSPGVLFGFAPSHHIIMDNLLVGRDDGEAYAKDAFTQHQQSVDEQDEPWKWETWDLKPTTYFFPERDIAQGKLTSEATKSRLPDDFNDKLVLSKEDAEQFKEQLRMDTELLAGANAVDYSLFLVRIPIPPSQHGSANDPFADDAESQSQKAPDPKGKPAKTVPTPKQPPFTPPSPPSWRTGIRSADGKYVYRAAVLDFFWAKHKVHAKMMTYLVRAWNAVDLGGDKGPMSITTSSDEYRGRFMTMCEGFIAVPGEERDTAEVPTE